MEMQGNGNRRRGNKKLNEMEMEVNRIKNGSK